MVEWFAAAAAAIILGCAFALRTNPVSYRHNLVRPVVVPLLLPRGLPVDQESLANCFNETRARLSDLSLEG